MSAAESLAQSADDFALMRRIAQRDRAALGELYDRYASLLYPLCMRILRDWMESQDVLTEVFWEVWNRAERYDAARGAPVTYLITLARSRAIDRRRAGGRKRGIGTTEATAGMRAGSVRGPERDAMVEELRRRVAAAMARLEPAQRTAVELSFFDHLSHSEIAEHLAKPLGTVKTHIRQGLIHLREFLRMEGGSQE